MVVKSFKFFCVKSNIHRKLTAQCYQDFNNSLIKKKNCRLYSILFWHIVMSKTAKNNLKHDTNSNSETWMALCIKIQILVFLFSAFQ